MSTSAGGENYVSVPRGSPLYLQNTVGPLTRVPNFERAVLAELESLKAEIGWDAPEVSGEEFSVDDLKVLTEEELVSRAFAEAFNGEDGNDDNTPAKRPRKRKGNSSNAALEEGYVVKVQELARMKQKQDEDKKAARLHSFDGSGKNQSLKDRDRNNTAFRCVSSSANAKASCCVENVPIHYPEIVICVEVYHYKRAASKCQEFLVLGQQFLTELKDKIYCLTDQIMNKEGQHDSSGYFLIEDVFCNDTRDPNSTDYSQPIFEWLEQSQDEALEKWDYLVSGEQQMQQKKKAFLDSHKAVPLPRFRALNMQTTRFCDVSFRLGAGYMYCHQGDCKHMVVFRDMRLIHPEDEQNRAAYPLITYQFKLRIRKCSACNIYKATKVTVDDKWAKDNPCYFCDLCYYMLHYQDESLLYSDFSVFDYFHE